VSGPLRGVRVVELAGIGPAPYACMLLADAGADVLRVTRPSGAVGGVRGAVAAGGEDLLARNRPSIGVDLKDPEGVALVLDLVARADALVEGFRPGVAERLGLGPDDCLARNERLVYGRMTGWGQDGPLAPRAGHDINYIAISGALWPIGRAGEVPVPPLNLVADFGGGGAMLAFGVLAAALEARSSGHGQVVDAAMVDGSASLTTMLHSLHNAGVWEEGRGANVLDTGAPFYEVYETSDGGYMAVGAIEPQFYAALLHGLGIDPGSLPSQLDRSGWPATKDRFAGVFATRTRSEWTAVFEHTDACVAPVLAPWEAPHHPHNQFRATFVAPGGAVQPAPSPRFGRTPGELRPPPDARDALRSWGVDPERLAGLGRP
jgi:alpha-methylacyl-CoA racemase